MNANNRREANWDTLTGLIWALNCPIHFFTELVLFAEFDDVHSDDPNTGVILIILPILAIVALVASIFMLRRIRGNWWRWLGLLFTLAPFAGFISTAVLNMEPLLQPTGFLFGYCLCTIVAPLLLRIWREPNR